MFVLALLLIALLTYDLRVDILLLRNFLVGYSLLATGWDGKGYSILCHKCC